MDQMMPKGREHQAPKVLGEDIDVQAAETLHDVVAHLAESASEEEVGGGGMASRFVVQCIDKGRAQDGGFWR